MLEYAVKHGQQVFAMSWRNPTESHADWDLDTYATAVLEALDAVEAITGAAKTPTCSACAPAGSCSPRSSRTSRPRASRTGSRA